MFLLDTNVPSELRRPRPDSNVRLWIDSQPNEIQYFSIISLGEIIHGMTRHPDPVQRTAIAAWIEGTLRGWFKDRLVPVSQAVAELAGELSGMRDRNGRPLAFADAYIAATAIEHDLILVTRNVDDFIGLPLRIINPWLSSDLIP